MATRRPRWLGVAYMVHEEDLKWPAISSWSVERAATLEEFDCVLTWPPTILSQWQVPESALNQARSFPLDRGTKQQKRCSADEATRSHVFGPRKSLPTFMAQYGTQHLLQGELVETRGYFAHWLEEDSSAATRFWHPQLISPKPGKVWVIRSQYLMHCGAIMLRARDPQLKWPEV